MKCHRANHLTCCLLAAVVAVTACDSGGGARDVQVVRDTLPGGVALLRYSALPRATDRIAEDLRIGVLEGAPEEVFGSLRSVEVDDEGTIYILDNQASEIRAFGADGRFLRTLTRRGHGPGEVAAANGLIMAPGGTLWVQDHGQWRIIGLNLQGEELQRFPMPVMSYGYTWEGTLDRQGRFWNETTHYDTPPRYPPEAGLNESTVRSYQKSYDPATEEIDSIFIGQVTARGFAIPLSGGWQYRSIPFASRRFVLVDPEGGFWQANGEAYRIARLDERGDTVMVLEVDMPAEPVTSDERRRFVDAMLVDAPDQRRTAEDLVNAAPAMKPVIDQLNLDDEGRLWVRRRLDADSTPTYDVFGRDGEYHGTLQLAFRPAPYIRPRIRDGRLYAISTDSLDVPVVIRANLANAPVVR